MRSRPTSVLLLTLLAAALLAPDASAAPASALLKQAEALDREVRSDEGKLRLRHNLLRVIEAWDAAAEAGKGADRRAAREGEAKAWALLAHWSGRTDDRKKAETLARALEAPAERKKAPRAAPKAAPKPSADPAWLSKVRMHDSSGAARLELDSTGEYTATKHVMPSRGGRKTRVFFDFEPMIVGKEVLGNVAVRDPAVTRLRVGQFDSDTARIVIDLNGGEDVADRLTFEDGAIHLAKVEAKAPPVVAAPAPKARAPKQVSDLDPRNVVARIEEALGDIAPLDRTAVAADAKNVRDLLAGIVDDVRKEYGEPEAEAVTEEDEEEPEVAAVEQPEPARAEPAVVELPAPTSVVAIRRVVIDAGHGGKDTGAIGPGRVKEADVNLAIAKRLGAILQKKYSIDVVYTRADDRFVSLEQRSKIANASSADLFISIHANAFKKKHVHGIETYYLNVTSNRYATRLARRENEPGSDAGESPEPDIGMEEEDASSLPSGAFGRDLRLLLADLAMRSATVESKRLAGYVQSSLIGSLRRDHSDVRDLGVKHALFYVLLGTRMPSILIETGFVTNPTEGKRLASTKYQEKVANAIARGVSRFVDERKAAAARVALRSNESTLAGIGPARAGP